VTGASERLLARAEAIESAYVFSKEADIAICHSSPERIRLVFRRLSDFRIFVYASRAYSRENWAPPESSSPVRIRD
jgi:hypothetical protein